MTTFNLRQRLFKISERKLLQLSSLLLVGLTSSSILIGFYFARRLQREDPYTNFELYQVAFHSLNQLQRETLKLGLVWSDALNQSATPTEIEVQFDILESRIQIIRQKYYIESVPPEFLEDLDEYYEYWEYLDINRDKIIKNRLTQQERITLQNTLKNMEFVTNRIVKENTWHSRQRYQDLNKKRKQMIVLIISVYCFFLILIFVFLVWAIKVTIQRKQALISLKLSEERYQKIVEMAEEGIWTIDLNEEIEFLNSKLMHILGYNATDLIGFPANKLCASEESQVILSQHLKTALYQGSATNDIELQTKTGKKIWFYISSSLLSFADKADRKVLSLLTNITERKKIEEELTTINESLSRQANLDELTQIANRRYFNSYSSKIWREAVIAQRSLSVILIDIDFFKKYNDYYGHLEGDICLFKVAQVINASAQREHDLAARYGGEEFVMILPNTPLLGAMKIIENLQLEIQELQIPHAASLVSEILTLSIGIASGIPNHALDINQVFNLADEALYRAKEQGRNQYISVSFGA